jgi:polysaccharide export outer membrane protein
VFAEMIRVPCSIRSLFSRRLSCLLLGLAIGLTPTLLPAQGRRTEPGNRDGESELSRDNLRHVAASAESIQAVLQAQPGLLIELKRWVAKDAADHGQIVNDGDLSDQAIFGRLDAIVEFRAVATQLLQRYGYLVPKMNPDSDAGKEQDLIVRERALQFAKQQESERTTTRPGEERSSGRHSGCDPGRDSNCSCDPREDLNCPQEGNTAPRPQRPRRTTTAILPESAAPEFDQGTMSRPASGAPGEESGAPPPRGNLTQADIDAGGTSQSLQRPNQISGYPGETVLPMTPEMQARSARPNEMSPLSPPEGAGGTTSRSRRTNRNEEREAELQPTAMVRRPNPYANIPSLYDMYLQAVPHPPQLGRFGADVFRDGTRDDELLPMDLPVGPDYVVGPGDGLTIDLWGGVSQRLIRVVDREGRVTLPESGPVLVSGRTLGEVQQAVQQVLRTQFRDVSADISLSRLRTIRVYVVGDVAHPGAYDISSLSTPLNALFQAGGPTDRGSMRLLRHYRGKQLVEDVDLYDLLLHGVRSGMERLDNGDTVLVPPLGPQLTVEGMVRRPAEYELHGEKNLSEALELAGGILPAAALRHIEVQRLVAHEKRTMLSLDIPEGQDAESVRKQLEAFAIHDNDDVRIFPIAPYNQDAIYLEGHVLRPGRYSYRGGMRLTDVVASYKDLLPEPSANYAEIIRLNPPDFHPSVESFDLGKALENPAAAPVLEPLDTIRIYSRYDFQSPPVVTVVGDVRAPGTYRTSGQIHLRDAIQMAGGLTPEAETDNTQVMRQQSDNMLKILDVNLREALAGNPLDNVLLQPRDSIVVHRDSKKVDPATVTIQGEVVRPGRYLLGANLRIADFIRLAGGLKRSADPSLADLTHYQTAGHESHPSEHREVHLPEAFAGDAEQNLALRDGDVLTIPSLPGWSDIGATVSINGDVAHAGTYGIRPGEKLSSVLKRAGGFLPTAYPEAAVFERGEVRKLQEKNKEDLIQRIEMEPANLKTSATSSAQDTATLQQAALQQRQHMIEALRRTPVTGRLVVHLRRNLSDFARTSDDIELRAGDSIFIPKRPNFVLIVGQVYNSNAITYAPRKSAGWYLSQAGGPTDLAEKGAIFIIRANGAVVTGRGGLWSGSVLGRQVEPGDTVVVPEKAIGDSATWKNIITLAQVAQSAAVTALVVTR